MRYLKEVFIVLLIISLTSCTSDAPGIEQYYENRDAGVSFLEANKNNEGIVTTSSGLQYKISDEGEGDAVIETDIIKVRYKSSLIDGTVLYNNQSLEIIDVGYAQLNSLLLGAEEGLRLMNVGSKYTLYLPYELAYGVSENIRSIKPFSVIILDIELLEKSFLEITDTGLQYEIINEGTGENALEDSKVEVDYHGTFLNGVVFDSSIDRGQSSEFNVN
jgi:FKBP-type peptidyl-prolyl cis-trans isomerase